MQELTDRLAVVTGGGSGMGRELARQLSAEGAHVAICDLAEDQMTETIELCRTEAPADVRLSAHLCDVADEAAVERFAEAVRAEHETDAVHLLFNNAGIGGGGSFVIGDRDEWDATFAVCWGGVYHCARAFMPMLVAADQAVIVNTSSVNGFWASLGPDVPHTAYSAAKFAVKGFTEALITDLAVNAPHVRAAVVMPGHIGTSIAENSMQRFGGPDPTIIRKRLAERGFPVDQMSDDALIAAMEQRVRDFRDKAPTSATEAATVILEGVRAGRWRILVGDDAEVVDELVRENPDAAYDGDFLDRLYERGHFRALTGRE